MAKFTFDGIDSISFLSDEFMQLTDDDKLFVIMPAAEYLAEQHSLKIRQVFHQRSGDLARSIGIDVKSDDSGVFAHVWPKGKHPKSSTGKRFKKDKNGKRRASGKYSGSNAEIAYILEYGSLRIRPRHWMESANEESEEQIANIQQDAWNDLMEKKGL